MNRIPHVPVSWGELLDKITILEIKRVALGGEAHANVVRELDLLTAIAADAMARADVMALVADLRAVNEALWDIEDAIRQHEADADFGPEFIGLARAVYTRNDERAGIKRSINLALGSALIEEKSYAATALGVAAE